MKKITALIVSFVLLMSMFAGCNVNSSKSFTFNVETGDSIKLKLDTTDDYDISSELPFVISCGDEVLSQGTFILAETYDEYVATASDAEKAKKLDSGKKDGNDYFFWCYNDTEWNYVIKINGSNTGIVLGNNVSEESAKECFTRLTITVE